MQLEYSEAAKFLFTDPAKCDFKDILSENERFRHYSIRCPKQNDGKFLQSQEDEDSDDYFEDLLADNEDYLELGFYQNEHPQDNSDDTLDVDFELKRTESEVIALSEHLIDDKFDQIFLEKHYSDRSNVMLGDTLDRRSRRNAVQNRFKSEVIPKSESSDTNTDFFDMVQNQFEPDLRHSRKNVRYLIMF